jgi:hypothetical protein
LVANPSIKCTDAEYTTYSPFVVFLSIFLPVGIIGVYCYELYYSGTKLTRRDISSPKDIDDKELNEMSRSVWPQLLHAGQKGGGRLGTGTDGVPRWVKVVPSPQNYRRACTDFCKDVLYAGGVGVSRKEVQRCFAEASTEHGAGNAVQLLRMSVRSADPEVKHLEFLYAGMDTVFLTAAYNLCVYAV